MQKKKRNTAELELQPIPIFSQLLSSSLILSLAAVSRKMVRLALVVALVAMRMSCCSRFYRAHRHSRWTMLAAAAKRLQLQLQPFSYFMYFACLKMFQFPPTIFALLGGNHVLFQFHEGQRARQTE